MIASVHIVESNPLRTFTRRVPQPGSTPGLVWSNRILCGTPSSGMLPKVQPGRAGFFAWWDDDNALDQWQSAGVHSGSYTDGWSVRLSPIRARARWPKNDMEISVDQARTHGGPHVAVTTGTVIARKALEFAKVSGELERQFNDDPDGLWGLNIATLDRMVMTITFWASQEATDAYVNAGAHRAAMRAHYEFPTDDHDFVSDGGFFGFSPYRMRGTLAGKNPFPAGLAAHIPDGF